MSIQDQLVEAAVGLADARAAVVEAERRLRELAEHATASTPPRKMKRNAQHSGAPSPITPAVQALRGERPKPNGGIKTTEGRKRRSAGCAEKIEAKLREEAKPMTANQLAIATQYASPTVYQALEVLTKRGAVKRSAEAGFFELAT